MALSELAGKPAPRDILVNVPRLVSAYYTLRPDPDDPAQRNFATPKSSIFACPRSVMKMFAGLMSL